MLKKVYQYLYSIVPEKLKIDREERNKSTRRNFIFSNKKLKNIKKSLKQTSTWDQDEFSFGYEEQQIIDSIYNETKELNRNNITRTNAYLQFYLKHPEVHWAFLASMVSRNGGYNMTDLKGSLIPNFLRRDQIKDFFSFLERSNALIFHDAFPQLLLYDKSKELNKDLFYLLPTFHVSRFMEPFWKYFFKTKDSTTLTLALIINEQNYIEKRVMENNKYKKKVLNTLSFQAQEFFHFSKVVIPYYKNKEVNLTGTTVSDFESLHDRIQTGKELYAILFGIDSVYKGALEFAQQHEHTGSRSDYWPHVFTSYKSLVNSGGDGVCMKDTTPIIHSPNLEHAWPDISHSFNDHSDWFKDLSIFKEFRSFGPPEYYSITEEYCMTLEELLLLSEVKDVWK